MSKVSETINISKGDVYDEVAKTTAYIGTKHQGGGDEGSIDHYEQVFTTDADRLMLERFFNEASLIATDRMKEWSDVVTNSATHNTSVDESVGYTMKLYMPTNYSEQLMDSAELSLFNFFVSYIVSKWCQISSPADSESYGASASAMLEDMEKKLRNRERPTRPDCCGSSYTSLVATTP